MGRCACPNAWLEGGVCDWRRSERWAFSVRHVRAVVLCEDLQQEVFVRRFLKTLGWGTRQLRVEKAPPGRGSAVQFVRQTYPGELAAFRRPDTANLLIVMVDGDEQGVDVRLRELQAACEAAGLPNREPGERVLILVPTWRIETWLAYLAGETVCETKKNYPRLAGEAECQGHVDALAEMCRRGHLRAPAPASLSAACEEYARLRGQAGP